MKLWSLQGGGFFSAEDADSLPRADASQKREGAFCVWHWKEVASIALFTSVFPFRYTICSVTNKSRALNAHTPILSCTTSI